MDSSKVIKDLPVFSIKIDAQMCGFRVELNGAKILQWDRFIPISTNIPVNEWIIEGNNKLNIILIQLDDAPPISLSECSVSLVCGVNNGHISETQTITNLSIIKGADNSIYPDLLGNITSSKAIMIKEENGSVSLNRLISLPKIFPSWKWENSQIIQDTVEVRESLFQEYQKIWDMLSKKNYSQLEYTLHERSSELGIAYYMDTRQMYELSGYRKILSDSNRLLYPLDDDFEFELFSEGRLARISRWNYESQLMVPNKSETSAVYFDFIFRLENNIWIISR